MDREASGGKETRVFMSHHYNRETGADGQREPCFALHCLLYLTLITSHVINRQQRNLISSDLRPSPSTPPILQSAV